MGCNHTGIAPNLLDFIIFKRVKASNTKMVSGLTTLK